MLCATEYNRRGIMEESVGSCWLCQSGGKKVKEICLKICGVNKGNGRLMIGERSKERMTDDSSIATS